MNPLIQVLDVAHVAAAGKSHKPLARAAVDPGAQGFQGILKKQLDLKDQAANQGPSVERLAKAKTKAEGRPISAETIKAPVTKAPAAIQQVIAQAKQTVRSELAHKEPASKTGQEAEFAQVAALALLPKEAPKPQVKAVEISVEAPVKEAKTDRVVRPKLAATETADAKPLEAGKPAARKAKTAESADNQPAEDKKFTVVDRRTKPEDKRVEANPAVNPFSPDAKNNPTQTEVRSNEDIKVVFQVGNQIGAEGTGSRIEAPVSRDAAAQLARHLHDKANVQIVDTARFVLRDNNQGEIRLILHPESLGKVKINLNLSENSLEGRILVENNTVKEAFQNNMDSLMQSFRDGGFQNLSLDVSVGGGQAQNRETANPDQLNSYGKSQSVSRVADEVPVALRLIGSRTDSLVDVMA